MSPSKSTRSSKAAKPAKPARPASSSAGEGTQAIRRAAAILKAVATAHAQGVSLADIARAQDLPRSTAHRILKCLVQEGFIEFDGDSRRYHMGSLTYELSLAVSSSAINVAKWRDAVESVARRTGVTTYLMRRSGVEAVCLVKAEGTSVVRVIPVEVGQRRLLGVGAGATALLAALDDESCDSVIETITPGLRHHPEITVPVLREAIAQARATGYASSWGKVVEGSFGLGMIVPDPQATASLAISIAAHTSLASDANIAKWKRILKEEIQAVMAADTPR